jgi:hypothetical protein
MVMEKIMMPTILDGVLRWLSANQRFLDPVAPGASAAPRASGDERFFSSTAWIAEPDSQNLRAFVSLTQLCMLAVRGGLVDIRIREWVRFCAAWLSNRGFQEMSGRDPWLLAYYLRAYVALERCGSAVASQRSLIQSLLFSGYLTAVERPIHQDLELLCWLRMGRFEHHMPSLSNLCRQSWLARPRSLKTLLVDPNTISTTLLALTGLGEWDLPVRRAGQEEEVRRELGYHLGIALVERRWGVVAHLVMACKCLRKPPPEIFGEACRQLAAVQQTAGFLPGNQWIESQAAACAEGARAEYEFTHNWQSTLALGFASC